MKNITTCLFVFICSFAYSQNLDIYYYNLGDTAIQQNNFPKAIEYFTNSISYNDSDTDCKMEALTQRAECKFKLHDYRGALDDCSLVISMTDIYPKMLYPFFCAQAVKLSKSECYELRGRIEYLYGKKENACKDWSKSGEFGNKDAYDLIEKLCN